MNCVEKMMLIGEPEEVVGKTALILDDMRISEDINDMTLIYKEIN